uniref:CBS domain-containing protein n=1 Tax=Fervidicoccus fontis TaxID=683846 RepID=A0A7J3ZKT7_9CREN
MSKVKVGLPVRLFATTAFPAVSKNDKLTKARETMRETGWRVLPVVDSMESMKLLGMLYRVDVLRITSSRSEALVSNLMSEPPVVLTPEESLDSALDRMLAVDEWYAPIVSESGSIVGVLGLENIIDYFLKKHPNKLQLPVKDHYTTGVVSVTPDDDIRSLWHLMLKRRYAGLPVVRASSRGDRILVGVITQYDLLKRGFARPELESESPPRRVRVREVMVTPAIGINYNATLLEVATVIVSRNIGRVYVTDSKNRLLGVIDREDTVKTVLEV